MKTTKKAIINAFEEPAQKHFLMRHPLLLPFIVIIALFFVGLALFISIGGETVGAADRHIVQINYDGNNRTVPTRSKTVGDLVKKIAINLGPKDIIEPSLDTPIVEDNFQITVLRARPLEVIDGSTKKIVQSAFLSPKQIAKDAGLTLYPEDAARFEQPADEVKGPIIADKVVIERSIPITVSLYGSIGEYRTRAKTIAGFLEEKSIVLKTDETTQPADLKSPITEGMLLTINAEGKQVVSVNESIEFDTQTVNNATLAAGQTRVRQEGVVGTRAVLYDVQVVDGVEVSRTLLRAIVLAQPVPKIVEKGTLAVASYSVSADKAALMAAAGIDASQYASVDYIISHESNWRPGAINSQGCIGLGQRCPVGGSNALVAACPNWQTDPVCQLVHFSAYANGRYGSWNAAYQVWVIQRWW